MALLKCLVWSISQQKPVNKNYIVNTENLPIQGLDPDIKIYGEHFTNASMEYESRAVNQILTDSMIETAHPVYGSADPQILTWKKTYTLEKKTNAEMIQAVRDAQRLADLQLAGDDGLINVVFKLKKVTNKAHKNQDLSEEEQATWDRIALKSSYMDDNAANAQAMIDFIELHTNDAQFPDFDEGWMTALPE